MSRDTARKLEEAIRQERGHVLARFFDIRHLIKHIEKCRELVRDRISDHLGGDIWMESFSYLLQVPLQPTFLDSFNMYNQASAPVIHNFKDLATTLSVPCIRSIASSLRIFASSADYNESVNQMQKLLRLALNARNQATKESSLLAVVNQLMAVYYLKNNFKQAENLLKSVDGHISFKQFPTGEVVGFHFNTGRIAAIRGQVAQALEKLQFAYDNCPIAQADNRRLILAYLIPVQLASGIAATPEIIKRYQMFVFQAFVQAFRDGDLAVFDQALDVNMLLLIKLGLFELMARARRVVIYRFLQIVHAAYGEPKIPLVVMQNALNLTREHSVLEVESLLAVLIEAKMIRAYVHHASGMVVFAQQNPFPPISVGGS
jgi:hypothetical protein